MAFWAWGDATKSLRHPFTLNQTAANAAGVSIAAWVRMGTDATSSLFGIGALTGCTLHIYRNSGDGFYAEALDNSTGYLDTTSMPGPIGQWVHLAASFTMTGTTWRICGYVNGAATATASGTASVALTGSWTRAVIGSHPSADGYQGPPADTALAEFAVWTGHWLKPNEALALARGRNPMRLGTKPALYHPLRRDLRDLGSGRVWLQPISGSTVRWAPHPPVEEAPASWQQWLARFAVARDFAQPLESSYGQRRDETGAVALAAQLAREAAGLAEIAGSGLASAPLSAEALAQAAAMAVGPAEFGVLSWAGQGALAEFGALARADATAPVEGSGAAQILAPAAVPIELPGSAAAGGASPLDAVAGLVRADATSAELAASGGAATATALDPGASAQAAAAVSLEMAATRRADIAAAAEIAARCVADRPGPVEFGGASATIADATAPVEIAAAPRADAAGPLEPGAGLRLDATTPLEPLGSARRDLAVPLSAGALRAVDGLAPAETGTGVFGLALAAVEFTSSLTLAGPPFDTSNGTRLLADAAAPIEVLGAVRQDAAAPVEVQAGARQDAGAPLAVGVAVLAEAAYPAATLAVRLAGVAVPVEAAGPGAHSPLVTYAWPPLTGRFVLAPPDTRALVLDAEVRAVLAPPDVRAFVLAAECRTVLALPDAHVLVLPQEEPARCPGPSPTES